MVFDNFNNSSKKQILNKTKKEFYEKIKKYSKELKSTNEIEGFASGAIVGEKNYPNLKVHSISNTNIENSFFKNNSQVMSDYSKIIDLKAKNILGSTSNISVKKFNNRITDEIRDIYKSKSEVEFSSKFEKNLKFDKIVINKVAGIVGSSNQLESLSANSNTSTSKQIEKNISNDIKATKAIINLYEQNVNENQIINLLALGSFGVSSNKKLVPTKWAISAYDQTIEKYLFNQLKKFKLITKYEVYEFNNKGNYFLIILFPEFLSGETIESQNDFYGTDYFNNENKLDKKTPQISGAYYANKLAVFEHLRERKRQSAFLSIRLIKDYDIPLGVVFVRECVRNSFKNKIFSTSNKLELEEFLKFKKNNFYTFYEKSKLLNEFKKRLDLRDYFN